MHTDYTIFFDEEAAKYGLNEAIVIQKLRDWLKHNKRNNKNKHDGYFWTFNSAVAWAEYLPYMSSHQIGRILKKLEKDGIVLVGNYNKKKYDRTKWYSLPEFKIIAENTGETSPEPASQAILQNCEMHSADLQDASCRFAQPIPSPYQALTQEKTTTTQESLILFSDLKENAIEDWASNEAEKQGLLGRMNIKYEWARFVCYNQARDHGEVKASQANAYWKIWLLEECKRVANPKRSGKAN